MLLWATRRRHTCLPGWVCEVTEHCSLLFRLTSPRHVAAHTAGPAPRPSAPKPSVSSSPGAAIPPGLDKAAAQAAGAGCGVSACFALDRSESVTAGDWSAMRAFVQTAIRQLTPAPTSAFLSYSAFAAVSFATDVEPIVSPLVRQPTFSRTRPSPCL